MTVWTPGMLAVCVDASDCPIYPGSNGGVTLNAVYRVIAVKACTDVYGRAVAGLKVDRHNPVHPVTGASGSHNAIRFRPLNEDLPRAELIARIKQCKPQSLPVTTRPVPDHADQDSSLRVGMELSGAPTTRAGGLTCPFETAGILSQQLPQPREDSFHNISKALSVVHERPFTHNLEQDHA